MRHPGGCCGGEGVMTRRYGVILGVVVAVDIAERERLGPGSAAKSSKKLQVHFKLRIM